MEPGRGNGILKQTLSCLKLFLTRNSSPSLSISLPHLCSPLSWVIEACCSTQKATSDSPSGCLRKSSCQLISSLCMNFILKTLLLLTSALPTTTSLASQVRPIVIPLLTALPHFPPPPPQSCFLLQDSPLRAWNILLCPIFHEVSSVRLFIFLLKIP